MPNDASPPQDPAGVTFTSVLTTPNSMAASSALSPPSLKSQRNQDLSLLRKSRTFRNIERDLVNKSKRLNDGKEEGVEKEASRRNDDQYIDKDRAIAVGAGIT